MAKYRLSPAAEKDLESIWQYTQQHWGVAQAQSYFETLVSAFESIAQTPALLATISALAIAAR